MINSFLQTEYPSKVGSVYRTRCVFSNTSTMGLACISFTLALHASEPPAPPRPAGVLKLGPALIKALLVPLLLYEPRRSAGPAGPLLRGRRCGGGFSKWGGFKPPLPP